MRSGSTLLKHLLISASCRFAFLGIHTFPGGAMMLKGLIGIMHPRRMRWRIHNMRRYIRRFGITRGLITFIGISTKRKGLLRVSIPQSRTRVLLRANTSDKRVFKQVLVDNNYEIPINIKPKVIVDGGANVGYASIYFANRYPDAQIIAVEPEISNIEVLGENTSGYSNVTIVQAGIWNKRTILKIENPEAEEWTFRVQESESEEGSIQAITIEDIIELSDAKVIDILKLDIEGAEKEVFSCSQSWLDKVNIVIVELHDRFKPGCSESFYSAVAKHNFAEFRKGEIVILMKPKAVICQGV
jgi:FkbM family methyltransferase